MNLMQGDCLERMKEIPAGSVDMVMTAPLIPPINFITSYSGFGT